MAFPPVHLPRGWGCHIPRIRKMSTGAVSGPGLNRSFPNLAFEILVSVVKCICSNSLSLELVTVAFNSFYLNLTAAEYEHGKIPLGIQMI